MRARRNAKPVEKLQSAELLADWFTESGMFDRAPEVEVAGDNAHGGIASTELAEAVELREAIYSLLEARLTHKPLPDEAVTIVNSYAAETPVGIQLVGSQAAKGGTVRQGLAALARETVEIVGGEDAALLRECGRPECTQVYLDRSRGHRREWCAMRTCGNRVKASNFRARHQVTATNTPANAPA
ncbi:CGNR zinc finger domain-containing protein [Leifsonia poae]|uniref:CGNR zinc finger domain-containing protein n=1 Tax=Leifsonia poae TaxID=110933 RepID=UPI003D66AEBF